VANTVFKLDGIGTNRNRLNAGCHLVNASLLIANNRFERIV
jgi:hypothetical protein